MEISEAGLRSIGWWYSDGTEPETGRYALDAALPRLGLPIYIVNRNGSLAISQEGGALLSAGAPPAPRPGKDGFPLSAIVPPLLPEALGAPGFRKRYGLRYAYVAGAMANGITSVEMVEAAGKNGMIGFFGAAGLSPDRIESAIERIQASLGDRPYGFNLIHSPYEPSLETATVDLYLRRGVRCISASAYLRLTLPLVLFRAKGIHRSKDGRIVCPNRVIAKVSRVEVAQRFFSPPPEAMLSELVRSGRITAEEASLASRIPVASDLTAEADSGGHTDNRPALTLFPIMTALRDQITARHEYDEPIWVGLGGGIATPEAAAAAFAMGAAYILTGTVNQACVEAGTSERVRLMLAEAGQADVAMAPSADMFEMGVKVQVLKRGTMFPLRAQRLYDLYRQHHHWEEMPSEEKQNLETQFFKCSFAEEWEQTRQFFMHRDPRQVEKANTDPRHKMALVFRAYLGKSSKWANSGEADRQMDYQIWCGPGIGAFNAWCRGTFLERPQNRKTVDVALNLLFGAAVLTRISWARAQGVDIHPGPELLQPRPRGRIHELSEVSCR
ncbi:MAG: PfaD family polyunsaturated fatty acid/polyketide biosynthesis protein [Desulfobacterales bacterium]